MRPPLDGVVLVTGASSGIGRDLARACAGEARALVLVARRVDRLEELKAELTAARPALRVSVQACDLGDLAAAERMVQAAEAEVGPIDVLLNNAGLGDVGLFEAAPWAKIEEMIRLNVTTCAWLCHRLLPGMIARGRGGILNVSSGFGLTWMPGVAAYAGTKHFVSALSESLRLELRGTGVVVTQVCPGPVDTEFVQVAGNPTGMDVPRLLQITPATCARHALRGFRRGRALVVPGWIMPVAIWLGRWTPRPILRLVYAGVGPFLRRRRGATPAAVPSPPPGRESSAPA